MKTELVARKSLPKLWLVATILAVIGGGFVALRISGSPPTEKSLTATFNVHRTDYELLKTMLSEDAEVIHVAKSGVQTTKSVVAQLPPQGMSEARFQEYLAIFNRSGAMSIYKNQNSGIIGVSVWAAGWGGNTQHVDFVWVDTNSLSYRGQAAAAIMKNARQLKGGWYIWTDSNLTQ
jgi:hypothetical protein